MNDLLVWLIKSACIFSVVGLYYHFILRNNKRHQANRVSLWTMMIISLTIPLIEVTVKTVLVDVAIDSQNLNEGLNPVDEAASVAYWQIAWVVIYLIGLLWHITGLTRQLAHLYRVISSSQDKSHKLGVIYIVTDKLPSPSTFFHYLFVREGETLMPEVEAHEYVHIRQFHSVDLLAASIFKSVLWFHPWAGRVHQYFREIHEYISDEEVIRQYGVDAYLQVLNIYTENRPEPVLVHSFASFIQKRIQMISKNSSYRIFPFLGAALVGMALFAGMSFKTSYKARSPRRVTESRDTLPAPALSKAMVVDTIITFDPTTGKESVQVVRSPLSETELLEKFPNTIEIIDTITTYDSDTRKESVMIVKSKMIEAYNILISMELAKDKPDLEKINIWSRKGKVK